MGGGHRLFRQAVAVKKPRGRMNATSGLLRALRREATISDLCGAYLLGRESFPSLFGLLGEGRELLPEILEKPLRDLSALTIKISFKRHTFDLSFADLLRQGSD